MAESKDDDFEEEIKDKILKPGDVLENQFFAEPKFTDCFVIQVNFNTAYYMLFLAFCRNYDALSNEYPIYLARDVAMFIQRNYQILKNAVNGDQMKGQQFADLSSKLTNSLNVHFIHDWMIFAIYQSQDKSICIVNVDASFSVRSVVCSKAHTDWSLLIRRFDQEKNTIKDYFIVNREQQFLTLENVTNIVTKDIKGEMCTQKQRGHRRRQKNIFGIFKLDDVKYSNKIIRPLKDFKHIKQTCGPLINAIIMMDDVNYSGFHLIMLLHKILTPNETEVTVESIHSILNFNISNYPKTVHKLSHIELFVYVFVIFNYNVCIRIVNDKNNKQRMLQTMFHKPKSHQWLILYVDNLNFGVCVSTTKPDGGDLLFNMLYAQPTCIDCVDNVDKNEDGFLQRANEELKDMKYEEIKVGNEQKEEKKQDDQRLPTPKPSQEQNPEQNKTAAMAYALGGETPENTKHLYQQKLAKWEERLKNSRVGYDPYDKWLETRELYKDENPDETPVGLKDQLEAAKFQREGHGLANPSDFVKRKLKDLRSRYKGTSDKTPDVKPDTIDNEYAKFVLSKEQKGNENKKTPIKLRRALKKAYKNKYEGNWFDPDQEYAEFRQENPNGQTPQRLSRTLDILYPDRINSTPQKKVAVKYGQGAKQGAKQEEGGAKQEVKQSSKQAPKQPTPTIQIIEMKARLTPDEYDPRVIYVPHIQQPQRSRLQSARSAARSAARRFGSSVARGASSFASGVASVASRLATAVRNKNKKEEKTVLVNEHSDDVPSAVQFRNRLATAVRTRFSEPSGSPSGQPSGRPSTPSRNSDADIAVDLQRSVRQKSGRASSSSRHASRRGSPQGSPAKPDEKRGQHLYAGFMEFYNTTFSDLFGAIVVYYKWDSKESIDFIRSVNDIKIRTNIYKRFGETLFTVNEFNYDTLTTYLSSSIHDVSPNISNDIKHVISKYPKLQPIQDVNLGVLDGYGSQPGRHDRIMNLQTTLEMFILKLALIVSIQDKLDLKFIPTPCDLPCLPDIYIKNGNTLKQSQFVPLRVKLVDTYTKLRSDITTLYSYQSTLPVINNLKHTLNLLYAIPKNNNVSITNSYYYDEYFKTELNEDRTNALEILYSNHAEPTQMKLYWDAFATNFVKFVSVVHALSSQEYELKFEKEGDIMQSLYVRDCKIIGPS